MHDGGRCRSRAEVLCQQTGARARPILKGKKEREQGKEVKEDAKEPVPSIFFVVFLKAVLVLVKGGKFKTFSDELNSNSSVCSWVFLFACMVSPFVCRQAQKRQASWLAWILKVLSVTGCSAARYLDVVYSGGTRCRHDLGCDVDDLAPFFPQCAQGCGYGSSRLAHRQWSRLCSLTHLGSTSVDSQIALVKDANPSVSSFSGVQPILLGGMSSAGTKVSCIRAIKKICGPDTCTSISRRLARNCACSPHKITTS